MLIMALYNQTTPSLKYVSLAEEWLPFTDVLPSATIGWATENMPWLIEEWKDLFENGGGSGSLGVLLAIGSHGHDENGGRSSKCTTNSSSVGSNKPFKPNKPQPTPEQKRSILRDMQNYSERFSVET